MASFYYAQNFPASTIPENLKKNANAVIRKDLTTIQINSINEIKYQYTTVTTVLNKYGDEKAVIAIPYEKGDNISVKIVCIFLLQRLFCEISK